MQGPRQGRGRAVHRLQLLGRPRLPRHGQVLQGPGPVRGLGLLRRVQQDRAGRAVGGRPADTHHPARCGCQDQAVHLRGGRADAKPEVLHLYHDEHELHVL